MPEAVPSASSEESSSRVRLGASGSRPPASAAATAQPDAGGARPPLSAEMVCRRRKDRYINWSPCPRPRRSCSGGGRPGSVRDRAARAGRPSSRVSSPPLQWRSPLVLVCGATVCGAGQPEERRRSHLHSLAAARGLDKPPPQARRRRTLGRSSRPGRHHPAASRRSPASSARRPRTPAAPAPRRLGRRRLESLALPPAPRPGGDGAWRGGRSSRAPPRGDDARGAATRLRAVGDTAGAPAGAPPAVAAPKVLRRRRVVLGILGAVSHAAVSFWRASAPWPRLVIVPGDGSLWPSPSRSSTRERCDADRGEHCGRGESAWPVLDVTTPGGSPARYGAGECLGQYGTGLIGPGGHARMRGRAAGTIVLPLRADP